MTYGTHQELAAKALAELVTASTTPATYKATIILQCRRQAVLTLNERMQHLGYRPHELPTAGRVTVAQLVGQPLWHLGRLLGQLPQPQLPEVAPSDILRSGRPNETSIEAAWRFAARHLFLATSELQQSVDQPWLLHPAPGWYAVADVADCAAALVAIDASLGRSGALPRQSRETIAERLLIATDVGRIARLWGTDPAVDDAAASVESHVCDGDPRITLVRTPLELIKAQQRLAAMVRPVRSDVDARAVDDRPGLRVARVLAAGQTRLSLQLATWAEAVPGAEQVVAEFRDRAQRYRNLHAATSRLVDVEPRRSTLRLIQQSEMLMQLSVIAKEAHDIDWLAGLNEVSHQLAANLGRALRRETIHRQSLMTTTHTGIGQPVPTPITNSRNTFYQACKALSEDPSPSSCHTTGGGTRQRRLLRATVELVATPSTRSARRMPFVAR